MSSAQRRLIVRKRLDRIRITSWLLAAAGGLVGAQHAGAITYTWTGAAGNNSWSGISGSTTNWSPNTLPPVTQSIAFTNTTSFPTVNLQTDRTINDVTFGGTQGYTLTGGTLFVTSGAITVNSAPSAATHIIGVPLTLGAAGQFSVASPETLSVRNGINDGTNNFGLNKSGAGTLTLQDTSSNLSSLSTTDGTLNINHATVTTRLINDFAFAFGANTNVTNGAQLISASTGFLKVAGANLPVLTMDGSTTSASGSTYFIAGFNGLPGAMDIRNQAQVSTQIFVVSVNNEGPVASTATIHSGATVTTSAFSIGGAAGALGTITVSDKDTAVLADNVLIGGFNTGIFGGTATMTVQSGAQVTASAETSFFTTTSTLIVDKATLTTARLGTYNGAIPLIQITNSGSTAGLQITNADVNTTSTYAGMITDSPDGAGGIRKTGAGNQIFAGQSTYTGGTRIEAGTLTIGATNALPTAGAITIAGGTLDLAGNVQQAGTVTLAGGGINMSTPGILLPSSLALQNGTISALTYVSGAVSKTTTGAVTVDAPMTAGSITVSAGTLAINQGASASTIQLNGGTLQFAGTLQANLSGVSTASVTLAGTATIKGNTTLSGAIAIGSNSLVSDSAQPFSAGSVTVGGGELLAKSGITTSGASSGFGTVTGKVVGSSAASWTASGGTLTLGDAGDANGFTGFDGTLAAGANQINLLSAGVANLGTANTIAGGSFSSLNGVQLAAGRTLSGFGTVNGAVNNAGTVTGGSGPNLLKFTGAVNGSGGFAGNIEFDGSYSPGNSPASVAFAGNATFGASSQLKIDLGGPNQGTDYDHIEVAGALALAGSTVVQTINGYVPLPGTHYKIASFGTKSGDTTIINQTGFAGLRFDKAYTATDLTLTAAALLNGDANLNGQVNVTDFNTLASHFGQSGQNWLTGDFNGDGVTNLLDLNAIATNFGASVPPSPAPTALGVLVPEPSVALLATSLALSISIRRRSRLATAKTEKRI